MKVKYKIGKQKITEDIELIFVETKKQGEIPSDYILNSVETQLISPNVIDFVEIEPNWLNRDTARLYITNISKWTNEECEIEI